MDSRKHPNLRAVGILMSVTVLLLALSGTWAGCVNKQRSVVLSTPLIIMSGDMGDLVSCPISNLSSRSIVVRTRLLDVPGGPASVKAGQSNDATQTVSAGVTLGLVVQSAAPGRFGSRVEFSRPCGGCARRDARAIRGP